MHCKNTTEIFIQDIIKGLHLPKFAVLALGVKLVAVVTVELKLREFGVPAGVLL